MKRIGIKFPDNDFYNTLRPFVQVLLDAYVNDPKKIEGFDKYTIVGLFNDISFGLYCLFQDYEFPHNERQWEVVAKNEKRTRKYLTIEKKDVFFDEEVNEYYLNSSLHCGHFHWVDFEVMQVFNV